MSATTATWRRSTRSSSGRRQKAGPPLTVPFADEMIGELVRSGFTEEQAARYFALFFQLRRAFYFILRSLAGECESMRQLREALWNNVFTHDMRGYDAALWNRMEDFSTLLLGETGTGKGPGRGGDRPLGVHPLPSRPSARFAANFTETFIAINLSQFPETLIESELFGHRKGSFTGAIDHHQGVFERCSAHGALFLDEIGEVSRSRCRSSCCRCCRSAPSRRSAATRRSASPGA